MNAWLTEYGKGSSEDVLLSKKGLYIARKRTLHTVAEKICAGNNVLLAIGFDSVKSDISLSGKETKETCRILSSHDLTSTSLSTSVTMRKALYTGLDLYAFTMAAISYVASYKQY